MYKASPEGLGDHHLLAQTDAGRPARQVVRHHLDGQPGGVGGEMSGREMDEHHAVLRSRMAFSISAWRPLSAERSKMSHPVR